MSYVPKYLEFQPRQADGWPGFVSEPTKEWATKKIEDLLDTRAEGPCPWVDLEDARRELFGVADRPECLRGVSLFDAQYAVAHRALLAAHAYEVWVKR